jgi:steroid delta-isomerase-like uncharacterized protein
MYIVAQHRIHDTAIFWAVAEKLFVSLPPERSLLQKLSDPERRRCVCVWKADSVEVIAGLFDQAVGHISVTSYFEVEESSALGLPGLRASRHAAKVASGKRHPRSAASEVGTGSARPGIASEQNVPPPSATEIARRFTYEGWNRHDLKALERVLAKNFIDHDPLLPDQAPGGPGFLETAATLFTAFPDLHARNLEMLEAGESVVLRWTARGTHEGALKGIPPTGRQVHLNGFVVLRIQSGLIVERWGEFDPLGMMRQLGMEVGSETAPGAGSASDRSGT